MEIIWHGQNCFTLKGSLATLVVNPYDPAIGLKPALKADIVIVSDEKEGDKNLACIEGIGENNSFKLFNIPGEYEVKEVLMTMIKIDEKEGKNILYMEMDGIRICHLGNLKEKLSDAMLEAIGDVDIILIPVGGRESLDSKAAHEVIEQLEPRAVIPMNYKIEGLKEEIASADVFMKQAGTHETPRESFKIKTRGELPQETTIFVQLLPQM